MAQVAAPGVVESTKASLGAQVAAELAAQGAHEFDRGHTALTPLSSAAQGTVPYGGGQLAHARDAGVLSGQVYDDLANGGAVADLGWGLVVRGQQRVGGLLRFAPLPPRTGHVGVQPSAPLECGELAGMEPSPGGQGRAGVAEEPVDAAGRVGRQRAGRGRWRRTASGRRRAVRRSRTRNWRGPGSAGAPGRRRAWSAAAAG